MKTKIAKAKAWVEDNKETLISAGIITGVTALYAGMIVYCVKEYNKQVADEQTTRSELAAAASRGASILPGPDGYYWILENQK